jgi:hypothetical protein
MTASRVVRIPNLSKGFGGQPVLRNVSLDPGTAGRRLPAGRFVSASTRDFRTRLLLTARGHRDTLSGPNDWAVGRCLDEETFGLRGRGLARDATGS